MARIYNQEAFEGDFNPSQQSRGFNAVRAADGQSKERDRMRQQLQDIDTQTKALSRQQGLDSGILRAKHTIETANMRARNATINGLLSLSKTAVSAMGDIAKQQEIQRQEDELNNETLGFLVGDENPTPRIDKAVELEDQQDAQAFAISDAAAKVSDDPAVRESIVGDSADALAQRSYTKISTHEAAARIGLDLDTFMASDEIITLPSGVQIRASEATDPAELAAVAGAGIRRLTSQYGLAGMDPKVLRQSYLRQAKEAYRAAVANRGRVMREAKQSERAIAHFGAASASIQGGVDPNEVYKTLFDSLKNTQIEPDPRKLNKMVRDHVIGVAEGMGDRGIAYLERLKDVRQVPGMKGTELGSGPYAGEIDRAIRRIRQGAVTDYRATKAEQQMSLDAQKSQFQRDLLSAETEEQRVQLSEQYEADLRQRALAGDQAAFTEYQSQVSIDNRYNPNAFPELMDAVASGERISQTRLDELSSAGSLTPDQATAVKQAAGDNFVEAVGEKLRPYQSGWTKRTSQELLKAFKINGGSQDRAEVANYADDATRILNERMADWMSQNEEASPAQIAERADRMIQEIIDEKVVTPPGNLMKPVYDFGTPQVPTKPYTNPVTGRQARNLQFMTTDQLQALNKDGSADNDLDIYNDTLITQNQFTEEVERMQAGSDFSPRIKQLARLSGVTPRNLVYAQAVGKGVDLDSLLMKDEGSGVEPTDIVSGTRYLQTLGFSARGSAYLAANIQQESSWNGMRDWPTVFNPTTGQYDGTSRNGGLISWASWATAPARLGAIENYLGKPIDQATHSEQLRAMVWEMETNPRFTNARRTFRNPNATDAQLRRASYEYWGYGHEGDRFGPYLDQALSAING